MAYQFRRFIDRSRPGDAVPEGKYSPEQLKAMLRNRVIVPVEVEEQPSPVAKQPVRATSTGKK